MPKKIFVPKKHQLIYMANHLTKEKKLEIARRIFNKKMKELETRKETTKVNIPPLPSPEEIQAAEKETQEFQRFIHEANELNLYRKND